MDLHKSVPLPPAPLRARFDVYFLENGADCGTELRRPCQCRGSSKQDGVPYHLEVVAARPFAGLVVQARIV